MPSSVHEITKTTDTVVSLVRSLEGEIRRALPSHIKPERIARITMTALRRTPKLLECDPRSLMGAILSAAALGLECNTPLGHAYLIPYGRECQLVLGYKGKIALAYRNGIHLQAEPVFDGDEFAYSYGLTPSLRHVPCESRDLRGDLKYVYVIGTFPDGQRRFRVITRADIEDARARSASASRKGSPWQEFYVEMALKTGIHRFLRDVPLTAELALSEAIDAAAEQGQSPLEAIGIDQAVLPPPDADQARERLEALKAEHAKAAEKANEADTPQQGELLEDNDA